MVYYMKITGRLTFIFLHMFPGIALSANNSQSCTNPTSGELIPDCIKKITIVDILKITIESFLILAGTIAVLFIIIGGFQYVTSAGNPENVAKAKNTITYSIIGLVITIISLAVVKFVIDNLN